MLFGHYAAAPSSNCLHVTHKNQEMQTRIDEAEITFNENHVAHILEAFWALFLQKSAEDGVGVGGWSFNTSGSF